MSPTLAPRAAHRWFVALVGTLTLLVATVALAGSPAAVRAAEHSVEIGDDAFNPGTVTVAVGDTITWTNADSSPHTVTAEDGSFDSGNLDEGQTFSHTFTAPGTHEYHCDYHSDMTATVVVEAAAAQPTVTASVASVAPTAEGQPDTALPGAATDGSPMAAMLIGLGLVALGFGVVPPRAGAIRKARAGGWRR
jgi:plastocyanin